MTSIHDHPAAEDTLGGRISLAREHAGLPQARAAQALGILEETWNAWECDRDVPRGNRLSMMAGVLGVGPIWLLAGVGQGPIVHPANRNERVVMRLFRKASDEVAALNQRLARLEASLRDDVAVEDYACSGAGERRR